MMALLIGFRDGPPEMLQVNDVRGDLRGPHESNNKCLAALYLAGAAVSGVDVVEIIASPYYLLQTSKPACCQYTKVLSDTFWIYRQLSRTIVYTFTISLLFPSL